MLPAFSSPIFFFFFFCTTWKFSTKISSWKKRLKYIPCDISLKVCKISFKSIYTASKFHQQFVVSPRNLACKYKLFCNFAFFCGDFLPVFESFWYEASFFSVFLWFLSLIVHVRLVWYLYFCSRKIKWFYLILLSPLPNDFCRFYICLRLQHFCRFENLIYKFCLDLDDFFSPYCNKAFLNF